MKVYKLKYLETKKIIKKIRGIVFMEDSGSIRNDMEMHPSGNIEDLTVVVMVDKSSKSPLFDGGGQFVDGNEEIGGNGVAIEEARVRPAHGDIIVKGFSEER